MQNIPFSKTREIHFLQHPNPKFHTNGKEMTGSRKSAKLSDLEL